MENEETYFAVLRALVASNQMNWKNMSSMRDLRKTLNISDDVHKRMMEEIKMDESISSLQNGIAPPVGGAGGGSGRAVPLPPKPGPNGDPGSLIGLRVKIIQEDDSTVEVVITGFDAMTREHLVVTLDDFPGGTSEPLPLMEHPEAYEIVGTEPSLYKPPPPPPMPVAPPPMAAPPPPPRPAYVPPPAAPAPPRRQPSGAAGGGGGGSKPSAPKVRPPRPSGGGSSGGGSKQSAPKQQPPYDQGYLAARLAVAQYRELGNLLSAISKKEQQVLQQLESVATVTQEVREDVARRATLVQQLQGAMANAR